MREFPGWSVAAAALLLAALISALAIGLAAAQFGPGEEGEEPISVRIVARNADNNRVELGLIEAGQSADNPILPSARFLSWATVDAADVTDWRYSSAITVGGGERGATVRIAARGQGGDRIEFILQQRAADGEWSDLPAPQARFFSRATTHTRWLRSSPLQITPTQVAPPQVPADPPSDDQSEGPTGPVAVVTEQAPVVDAISCEPASPIVGETITCTADLSGGAPDSYAWSGGGDPATGSDASFSTSFDSAGDQTISLTVANTLGEASASTTFAVEEAPADGAPVIDGISCEPASPVVGETVACTADLSGGAPDSYAWSGGGDPATGSSDAGFATSFESAGDQTISLTVANTLGEDTQSTTVAVVTEQAPTIDGISCEPDSPVVGETIICSASLSGGKPDTYAWRGGAPATGADASFSTAFDSIGDQTISLTVANTLGDDTQSTTVAVQDLPPPAPTIDSLSCAAQLDGVVRCSAVVGNDDPSVSYAWSGGGDPATGSNAEFVTSFAAVGDQTISLTVSNSGGSASNSTTVAVQQVVRASAIDSISCSPASPDVNETVTCSADLSGGEPDFYTWRGGGDPPGGNDAGFTTTFASPGERTVSLAVSNIVGQDSATTTVAVRGELREPVLDGIDCAPNTPTVGQTVTCSAILSGGPPDSYTWSGDGQPAAGSDASFTTTFASAGNQTVTLFVANTYGSSITLTFTIVVLEPLQAPVVDSVSCEPNTPTVGQTVTCTAVISGGEPSSYAWTGGDYATAVPRGETYTTTFSSPGSHPVRFTALNTAGSNTQSTTVNVQPAPTE